MNILRNLFYGVPVLLLCMIGGLVAMLADGFDWAHFKLRTEVKKLEDEWNR